MVVKGRDEAIQELERSQAALKETAESLERVRDALADYGVTVEADDGLTVNELSTRYRVNADALVAFAETAGELLGERPLTVESARRAGLLAASAEVWEDELGPLLTSSQVRELLGNVSRQRVDERLRERRLIGLLDQSGRRRFPGFQFHDGQPLAPLIDAFWTIASAPVDEWTAASWCVSGDDALDGLSPAAWARADGDADRLARVARQDAARLAR